MTTGLQIYRICLSVNVKMFTFKNTNMENIYHLLTQVYVDIDDGKPETMCFLCYARLQQCDRLQQQAIKSNELLEQLLRGGFMHETANAILNNQYTSQALQVSTMYHLDLEPATCEDVLLDPNLEVNSLISVKEEHLVLDFSEDGYDPYSFCPEAINSDLQEDEQLNAMGSDQSNGIKNFGSGLEQRKQQKKENQCKMKSEKDIKNEPAPFSLKRRIDVVEAGDCINSNRKLDNLKTERVPKQAKIEHSISNKETQNENLISTKTTMNDIITEEFECNECGNHFSTKQILTNHIFSCISTRTTETLVSDHQLTQEHMLNSSLSEVYSCDICAFKTDIKRYIETHLKMHTVTKVFSCNICEYLCAREWLLKRHMKQHTGEKPLSCNICEYRCVQKAHLERHVRTHIDQKPFSCNICKFKCVEETTLKRHIKTHREKSFSCNICENRFAQKSDLKIHVRIHTGEKRFFCNSCEYKCAKKNDLKRHMRIHTGEKPFSCNICEFRCALKHNLKAHMKTHK